MQAFAPAIAASIPDAGSCRRKRGVGDAKGPCPSFPASAIDTAEARYAAPASVPLGAPPSRSRRRAGLQQRSAVASQPLQEIDHDHGHDTPTIITIALNQLVQSDENVRRTGKNDRIEELVASIRATGLRQNLIVRAGEDGRYAVVAGGRRLRALKIFAPLRSGEARPRDKASATASWHSRRRRCAGTPVAREALGLEQRSRRCQQFELGSQSGLEDNPLDEIGLYLVGPDLATSLLAKLEAELG